MKVLLAIDDSPYSQAAVTSVSERPWPASTEFLVLTVTEPFHPDYAGWDPGAIPDAYAFEDEQRKAANSLAAEAAQKLIEKFGEVHVGYEAAEGKIEESIVAKAVAWKADLIVMGSHGRNGLQRLILGSVSQSVVTHAPCSVEIIKQPNY